MTLEALLWAVISGFLPAILWLFFWLKEDEAPEPNRLIFLAFWAGILAIPAALVFSSVWMTFVRTFFGLSLSATHIGLMLVVGFAFIEEVSKYAMIKSFILWRKEYDEPADAMIYLIAGALGFAAIENVLYLIGPYGLGFSDGFTVSNLRFIGATPLHALSAGILGYFIGGSFFRSTLRKEIALGVGLFFATLLHALFNILILMREGYDPAPALVLLGTVGILILFAFERIKHKLYTYYA